ncbi:MAG: bifunctional riboflavin kinase/FAD synthetase [Pseudomonadota bacterium]|nr:bifunctional riboflavin kinase/FAD synthetase [Pseudomonadota bacterium]
MELIRHLDYFPQGCVATIGNFDGVHLGHQRVLQQLTLKAQQLNLPTVVMIFEPQPQEFFTPEQAPPRLTRLREKLSVINHYHPVDKVLCLRFNAQLARLSPAEFIHRILLKGLNIKHLVIGDDFRFGQGRQGDFMTLQQAGQHYGFTIERWHTFLLDNQRVSSTRVRQALAQGDLSAAQRLLGRPYSLWGRVGYGHQRGRLLGFPTANIALHRLSSPINGVFTVYVHGLSSIPVAGIANLGKRPTVDGKQLLLEVHLFNFNDTIYQHSVEVELVAKLRDEQKFASLEDLKQQIQEDVLLAQSQLFG